MVVPNREIANKSIFNFLAMSSLNNSNNVSEDITMDGPRGRSNACSKTFSQLNFAVPSSSSIFNINYGIHIEIQSDDPNWANQTDTIIFNIPFPSQVKGGSNNHVPANNNLQGPTTHVDLTSNLCSTPNQTDLSPPSLSYTELQPADVKS